MLKLISNLALRLFGWKLEGKLPKIDKYVLIGAPHTSNWDSVFGFLGAGAIGLRFKWVAKQSVFPGPLSPLLKYFGGIPVDRNVRSSVINKMVELFNSKKKFVLGIMPEGTRSKTEFWKTHQKICWRKTCDSLQSENYYQPSHSGSHRRRTTSHAASSAAP